MSQKKGAGCQLTFPARVANMAWAVALQLGLKEESLLQGMGVRQMPQEGLFSLIPLESYLWLAERIDETGGAGHLFNSLVQATTLEAYGHAGMLAMVHSNYGKAFRFSCKLTSRISNSVYFRVGVAGEDGYCQGVTPFGPVERAGPVLDPFLINAVILLHLLVGKPARFTGLELQSPPPLYKDDFEAFFGCPVAYGQPANLIRFPAEWMDIPNPGYDERMLRFMLSQTHHQLLAEALGSGVTGQLRRWLLPRLGEKSITLHQAARSMNLHPRTLQSRLKEEGRTFRDEVDQIRLTRTIRLLLNTHHPLEQLSDRLGFLEAGSFIRFFKEKTGLTPRQLRDCGQPNGAEKPF